MGQITLNREDAERILASTESSTDARVIAAMTIAFFEVTDSAADVGETTSLHIAQKLLHMTQRAIYDAFDERREQASG